MNNAKMWLVVKPTVGVPLFLSAVAVGSFAVHVAVLSNTTWVSDFLSGSAAGGAESAALTIDTPTGALGPALADASAVTAGERLTVVLPDGRRVVAVVEETPTIVAYRSPAIE
jgi:light-harvesting protein B-800-850 alpha chain